MTSPCAITSEDLRIIENFITKRTEQMEMCEIQSIVKMVYELYKSHKRLMMPTFIIETTDLEGKK